MKPLSLTTESGIMSRPIYCKWYDEKYNLLKNARCLDAPASISTVNGLTPLVLLSAEGCLMPQPIYHL